MQDFRSMQAGIGGGGAGRIFGGGERRFRPYPNQALKCPRCESLNTKFCYYNNYNLSQPRHFCKSCRRYWTKGGVLRNVPVGGGCRKTKRSKPKSTQQDKKSNASHSSSESSSLTNTEGPAPAPAPAPSPGGSGGGFLNTFADSSRYFVNETQIPTEFQTSMLDDGGGGGMFGESNGSFTSLMTVSNPSLFGYNFGEVSPFRFQQHQQEDVRLDEEKMASMIGVEEEMKMQELATAAAGGVGVDQRVPVDFPGMEDNRTSNGELTALDWQGSGGGDQGLFDLAGSVDDQGYWSQSQWTDNDQHLYLPP